MGIIKRSNIPLEDQFTQVPNAWIRDERLSYRARGVLAALLSHTNGFEVSENGLAARGAEGRDAIRKALAELREHGYLATEQGRLPDGKLGQITWTITSPTESPVAGKPLAAKPATGESDTKNTNSKKTNSKKTISYTSDPGGSDPIEVTPPILPNQGHDPIIIQQASTANNPVSPEWQLSIEKKYFLNAVQELADARKSKRFDDEVTWGDWLDDNFERVLGSELWGHAHIDQGWIPPSKVIGNAYEAGVWLNKLINWMQSEHGEVLAFKPGAMSDYPRRIGA